jgi:amino acid permease
MKDKTLDEKIEIVSKKAEMVKEASQIQMGLTVFFLILCTIAFYHGLRWKKYNKTKNKKIALVLSGFGFLIMVSKVYLKNDLLMNKITLP